VAGYDDISFADIKRTKDTIDWALLRALQWYRGDSLQTLVWDTISETLRTYGLFYLLRYGDVEFHSKREFQKIVSDDHADELARTEQYVDGFCTYHGPIDTSDEGYGRNVAFTGPTLNGWIANSSERTRKPAIKDGLKLHVGANGIKPVRNDSVDVLNQRMQNRGDRVNEGESGGGLLCYPVSGRSTVVKNTYDLGPFFFLYPIHLTNADEYSLAIGTDALYLHCHVQERRDDGSLIDL
jgi:CRISPR-associated endonuclease/helicase Cas3